MITSRVTGNNAVESGGEACMHSLGDEDYLGSDANTLRTCAHVYTIVYDVTATARSKVTAPSERELKKKKFSRYGMRVVVSFCRECG